MWLKKEQSALNGNRDKKTKRKFWPLEDLRLWHLRPNASAFPASYLNTLLENRRWGIRQREMCHLLALLPSPALPQLLWFYSQAH